MSIEIIPAHEVPPSEQARVFSEAFAGYIGGSFQMDAAGLALFLSAQGIDLCYSRFARRAGELCGFGYITHDMAFARLAGMGVLASTRRSGVARRLLGRLLEEARARGDRAMLLEVIEQNPAACALYEKEGFQRVTRLGGWRRPPGQAAPDLSQTLTEVPLTTACQWPNVPEFPAHPWQISRHALARLTSARAFTFGDALAVISDPAVEGPLRIHAATSRSVLGALLRRYPEREFVARPFFPEKMGAEIFAPLSFAPEPLRQWLMRYDF